MCLGITNGALMKVQKGKPHTEGKSELEISLVTILYKDDEQMMLYRSNAKPGSDESKAENVFHKQHLGKLTVNTDITVAAFRKKIYEELIKTNHDL